MNSRNIVLGFLALSIIIVSCFIYNLTVEVREFKDGVNAKVTSVEESIVDFTKVIDNFVSKHGDDMTEALTIEVDLLKAEAKVYADSLRVKASEWLDNK